MLKTDTTIYIINYFFSLHETMESSTRIKDARDVIEAMILKEKRFYKCQNYLSFSTTATQASAPVPTSSPLQIVEGIAIFFRNLPLAKAKDAECCISPGGSISEIYHDSNQISSASFRQHVKDGNCRATRLNDHQLQEQQQNLKYRSSRETLCLSAWRHQMVDWACAVCQVFNINESVLEIAFNILDRYVTIELTQDEKGGSIPVTREDFQLFSMVSFYISSKVSNRYQKLKLYDLIDMAQGYYTEADITTTERDILTALNWHVHPPTIIDYCDVYLNLFPRQQQDGRQNDMEYSIISSQSSLYSEICVAEKEMLEYKCECIAENVLDDEFFLDKSNSVTALAIVLLATDASRGCGRDPTALQTFLLNVQGVVNVHKPQFDSVLRRLERFC